MRKVKRRLKILVTAGPTRERLDPVRFISNYATGFLGGEIARQAKQRGHRTVLIWAEGTAQDLQKEIEKRFNWCDCLVMTAAVCDFRPAEVLRSKIKRREKGFILRLRQNPDILKSLSRRKAGKTLVGFALETENLKQNARAKLQAKNLDLIVATQMNNGCAPFGRARMDALIIEKSGCLKQVKRATKARLARIVLDSVEKLVLS